jgi:hypothetical protein
MPGVLYWLSVIKRLYGALVCCGLEAENREEKMVTSYFYEENTDG